MTIAPASGLAILRDRWGEDPDYGEWRRKARPEQLPPDDWRRVLYLRGGRGSGKTWSGAHIFGELIRRHPVDRDGAPTEWGVVAPTIADARDTCMENPRSGLLKALGLPRTYAGWNRSQGQLRLPGGQMIYTGAADDGADRIQGKNLSGVWGDEVGMWERWELAYDEAIAYAVRIDPARILLTGTPKADRAARKLIKRLLGDPDVIVQQLRTLDNLDNLSPAQRAEVEAKLGTRQGRQELEGDLLEDVEGALWTGHDLEEHRVLPGGLPHLAAVVVGVDPAVSVKDTSDETGVVVAARGANAEGYVLADDTLKASPGEWARAVWKAALDHGAEAVVVEDNQGGDMVEHTLRIELASKAVTAGFRKAGRMPPPIRRVHPGSRQGKRARATPIAELYERGLVHHVTDPSHDLSLLEEQMTSWDGTGDSPDRVDALVHALTWLFLPGEARGRQVVTAASRWGRVSGRR